MKYRKIPEIVDAEQFLIKEYQLKKWESKGVKKHTKMQTSKRGPRRMSDFYFLYIGTDKVILSNADYIITDSKGNKSRVKRDYFEKNYERV